MLGVVDVGGGLRGIYSAGILDWCLDNHIEFDYGIGVSAGAANLIAYIARQPGRNYLFYAAYAFRREYMGIHQKITTGNLLNVDYIYDVLSNSDGENPLDFPAFKENPMRFTVVATDAETGEPVYYDKAQFKQDDYRFIAASSNVPWVNHAYEYEGHSYFDGAISDPIPVEKAFADGCDKAVVILTRPKDHRRDPKKDAHAAKSISKQYPKAGEALANRAATYNAQLELCLQYEKEGKVLIVAPDDISGMSTLTRSRKAIDKMYEKGRFDAAAIADFI